MICSKPLDMTRIMNDFESTSHDLERVEECYKILVDAGSDPTAICTSECAIGACQTSTFTEQLERGTLVWYSCHDSAFTKQLTVNRRN